MGTPSIFIRTGGCTLKCEGFGCTVTSPKDNSTIIKGCDSIHAVNAKHFAHTWNYYGEFYDLIMAVDDANEFSNGKYAELPDIVFTGGEPLLHHKDPVMFEAVEYFISRGHRVFFETNGTVDINFKEFPMYENVQFSLSVKMVDSGEPVEKRWKPVVVNNYLRNTKGSYFKFVASKEAIESGKFEKELFEFLNLIPTFAVVYLMPLGETTEQVEENARAVYEYAMKNGFRYSDRIHVRMYSDMRGV